MLLNFFDNYWWILIIGTALLCQANLRCYIARPNYNGAFLLYTFNKFDIIKISYNKIIIKLFNILFSLKWLRKKTIKKMKKLI